MGSPTLGLTLGEAVRAIDNVVTHINESTAFFSEQPALLARLHHIETELDAEIARDAIDTSASALRPALVLAPGPAPAPPASSTALSETAPEAAADAAPAEEFDHEIANIYSEEATELIEAAQVSLTAWNQDRKDK